ncbi:MAG: hypothetical protein PWQ91_16 [Eubacteriales bacterium]|nr:hypothetical protein [Eubacteriales bacterium]
MKIEIRGLEKLSFRERQVVVLKEMGYGNEEVGRRLGISPATVATLYNRARNKGFEVVAILDGAVLGIFDEDGSEEGEGTGKKKETKG